MTVPRCRVRTRLSAIAVAVVVVVLPEAAIAQAHASTTMGGAPSVRAWNSGVFSGYGPVGDQLFALWRGAPIQTATDFIGGDNWGQIENPAWAIAQWATAPAIQPVLSIQLWPATGGSLGEAAAGDYDNHYKLMASNLVAGRLSHAVLRIGWEFNATWYRWSVTTPAEAAEFAKAWRHIVRAVRSVPGEHFSFDWCVNLGPSAVDPALAFPGRRYVDTVGADVYDWNAVAGQSAGSRWKSLVHSTYGLAWQAAFAVAHHRKIAFPEWGLVSDASSPTSGGGDDPRFILGMHRWFASHNTAFEDYFDCDTSYGVNYGIATGNGLFPRAGADYQRLFSSP